MKKIFIVSGARSEFGLQENLLTLFKNNKLIDTFLIVTGSHLSKFHGNTINYIRQKKFTIFKTIKIISNNNSINEQISKLIYSFSKVIKKSKPDILILVGDRYEVFACAIAAYYSKIKIAHIHGGEITFNSLDDGARHSISKLSDIHFVANKIFKKKLIDMGENKKKIYISGGLGVDKILSTKFLRKKEIENNIKCKLEKKNYLLTFHPEKNSVNKQIKFMRKLFKYLSKEKNLKVIITAPNSDIGNNLIIKEIKKNIRKYSNSFIYIPSLGNKLYYSLIKYIDLVIGNSSSGICEIPTFKKTTINIGPRQQGRPRSQSIIDINYDISQFIKYSKFALSSSFQKKLKNCINPYGNKKSSYLIYKKILSYLNRKKND